MGTHNEGHDTCIWTNTRKISGPALRSWDMTSLLRQDVVWLEISVTDPDRVDVRQRSEKLMHVEFDEKLWERALAFVTVLQGRMQISVVAIISHLSQK
jgi:hypothetical protein